MSGGHQAPAKPLGPRQSAAAAYAVDLVITGKNIDVMYDRACRIVEQKSGKAHRDV
jgi:hypothetical protein